MTKESQLRQRSKLCGDAMERCLDEETSGGGRETTTQDHLKGLKHRSEREDMYSSHQFQAPSDAVDMKGNLKKLF